jgi:DNA mismatch repair protein MSH5
MAPGSKRKRHASHSSSDARPSQSWGSHGGRFKRPSVPLHPSPQRLPVNPIRSQAVTPRHTPQAPAPSQAQAHRVADSDDEVDEDMEQVVMAIDRQQKGTIGCAYYVAREEKLYCLQDVINGSMETVETCGFRSMTRASARLT